MGGNGEEDERTKRREESWVEAVRSRRERERWEADFREAISEIAAREARRKWISERRRDDKQ